MEPESVQELATVLFQLREPLAGEEQRARFGSVVTEKTLLAHSRQLPGERVGSTTLTRR